MVILKEFSEEHQHSTSGIYFLYVYNYSWINCQIKPCELLNEFPDELLKEVLKVFSSSVKFPGRISGVYRGITKELRVKVSQELLKKMLWNVLKIFK